MGTIPMVNSCIRQPLSMEYKMVGLNIIGRMAQNIQKALSRMGTGMENGNIMMKPGRSWGWILLRQNTRSRRQICLSNCQMTNGDWHNSRIRVRPDTFSNEPRLQMRKAILSYRQLWYLSMMLRGIKKMSLYIRSTKEPLLCRKG